MLQTLQVGRAVAALMVVLFHLNGSIWGMEKYFPEQFAAVFGFGPAGVQFFFVLSGFIIFHVHRREIGQRSAVGAFLFKRFSRVFPPYWAVLLVLIPVYFIVPEVGDGSQTKPLQVFTSIFLLPYPQDPILTVGWTLKHEVLFYLLFGLWIADKWIGSVLLILWQAACIVALGVVALGVGALEFPASFILSPNNILFGFGIVVAYLTQSARTPYPALLALLGIAAFLATGLHEVYASAKLAPAGYILMFGGASAIAVLGLAALERKNKVPVPKLLVHLGDASYATYLIHFPLLSLLAKSIFAAGLDRSLPQPLLFVSLFCVAIAAGSMFHLLIERPAMALLRGRVHNAPS